MEEKEIKVFLKNVSIYNCNCRLNFLYSKRDQIGEMIDKLNSHGYDPTKLEADYDEVVKIIEELCKFRNSHPDCLLEGDPGYCM